MKTKDMRPLHDLPKFSRVIKDKQATLRNHKGGGNIGMYWGWNDESSLDQVFALRIPYKGEQIEVIIDWQEMMHYGRAVSDWKLALEDMKRKAEMGQL